MNHTLLPELEQKYTDLNYKVRLITVAVVALSFAGLIGIAALFPAYIHATTETKIQHVATIATTTEDAQVKNIRAKLTSDAALLGVVASYVEQDKFSTRLSDIIRLRDKLSITAFSFSNDSIDSTGDNGTTTLVIRGISPTRDALLAFRTRLEADPLIDRVELPVSELTKSTSLPFSLSITYKKL